MFHNTGIFISTAVIFSNLAKWWEILPSEMDFMCVLSGETILHFVSDIKVNNTDWQKFKFFFKLLLFRSIFQSQVQKRAHRPTALKSLEQVDESFNSICEQTDKEKLSAFFRFLDNTSQIFFDCSTYKLWAGIAQSV